MYQRSGHLGITYTILMSARPPPCLLLEAVFPNLGVDVPSWQEERGGGWGGGSALTTGQLAVIRAKCAHASALHY